MSHVHLTLLLLQRDFLFSIIKREKYCGGLGLRVNVYQGSNGDGFSNINLPPKIQTKTISKIVLKSCKNIILFHTWLHCYIVLYHLPLNKCHFVSHYETKYAFCVILFHTMMKITHFAYFVSLCSLFT